MEFEKIKEIEDEVLILPEDYDHYDLSFKIIIIGDSGIYNKLFINNLNPINPINNL